MSIFKISKYACIFSIIFIGLTIYYLNSKDLKYGLEFSGGTELIIEFNQKVDIDLLREHVSTINNSKISVQLYDNKSYLIKFPYNENANTDIKKSMDEIFSQFYINNGPRINQIDFIGPKVGKELVNNGLMSIIYGSLAILIYVFIRFNFSFAMAAISALFHDFLIAIFFILFLEIEITLTTIAALLTVIGYSVNDTIVIFDRVRENLKISKDTFTKTINTSIIQTLSRTILTVITVLIVLFPLYFFGGPIIKDFALIMIIGVMVGTYSSIFFAPFLMYIFSGRRISND
tara:strand:+ start:50942 stop:51808 length:867 start_codon:yes stop_codon:yes gene_type:complete